MPAYRLLDQILHRLALQATPIAELSFDIDQRIVRTDPNEIVDKRHLFISGLARAGTTALMRRFYASGTYRSLTYRDMPFVLAPNLWRILARRSKREVAKTERAHGDRILVDADSPESLDEVFWRIYAGVEYIEKTHLKPHWPDAETIWKYVCYVNAVLDAQETRLPRYLSKNNNNILRLDSIRQAFPRALILVPFREPLAHAQSLLRQHRRFIQMQAQEGFVRSYMTWLAHHEFGCDHRPFRFGDDGPFLPSSRTTDTLDYWLEIWCETYGWLERSAPEDAVFVCYEDLCNRAEVWSRLAGLAGISADLHEDQPFQASSGDVEAAYDFALAEQTSVIYSRLAERARIALR